MAVTVLLAMSFTASASATWDAKSHQIAAGDFNGDGKTDILFIADDPGSPSGIALSTGGTPGTATQTWPSDYLGIPWHGRGYSPIIGDFNGDGRSDILLQRQSRGDHYLLLAKPKGKFTAIYQTLRENLGRQAWSAGKHRIVPGDFDGDGRCDVFLQAVSAGGLNAVFLASPSGSFGSARQTWADGYLGFRWSTQQSMVDAGDFNGDRKADLLVQARPDFMLLEGDVPVPIPLYRPYSFGVLPASLTSGEPRLFYKPALQIWDREIQGVDWSALLYEAVVVDFNHDGRADVVLRGRDQDLANRLFLADRHGQFAAVSEASGREMDLLNLVPVRDGSLPANARGPAAISASASRD